MKITILPGAPLDGSHYLVEILRAFGLCSAQRMTAQDAARRLDPTRDVLILPHGAEHSGLDSFLQSGGHAIAIRPSDEVAAMTNLRCTAEAERPSRLRLTAPICTAARGEPLWTLGPRTIYESDAALESAAAVAAYLFEPGDTSSESAGIFECAVGNGSLTIFAYDPAVCIMRLRQGTPERANYLPPGQTIPRSIHLHEPNAPQDTAWRPTADLHAVAFCDVVTDLLSRHAPVPTLWHIPGGRPALLVFSGDEDGSAQEENQLEMTDLETHDGRMSLYVIADGTSITREHIESYEARGHTISVHPNLVPTCGQTQEQQLAKAEADVLLFREKFGQPVHTVRNHCTMWPGYVDVPLLWQRLGIGMDANCFASRFQQSPDWGPYVNVDAAVPLPFAGEDGSLIDVFQQPTAINDDVQCHPTVDYSQKYSVEQFDWIARRMLEDATRFFHAPICANFHPCNYARFAGQQGQALMRRAREFDMPIWSLDRWHDFWRARAAWRLSTAGWDGRRLSFNLTGPSCEQLWITLPVAANGSTLSTIYCNGTLVEFEKVEHFQRLIAQAPLPHGAGEVEVVAEYN